MEDNKEKTIKGKKIQMTQVFTLDGRVIPVTRIKVEEGLESDMEEKTVVMTGNSKGKGFTGVMKKWNFSGQQATRGQSDKARAPGSIGAQTPGRVFKGKKMAGKHGNKKVTIKGSKVVKVDMEQHELFVSGPVPGARNSQVLIKFNY